MSSKKCKTTRLKKIWRIMSVFRCCVTSAPDSKDLDTPIDNYKFQFKYFDKVQFVEDCLHQHNAYRSQHRSPPLQLSAKLCRISQEWADHLAKEDHMRHQYHLKYGENLYSTYLTDNNCPRITGQEPVDSWYSEHRFYSFDEPVNLQTILKAGHFTQVVWKSTKDLGVGVAKSRTNRVYVVANYEPAGNELNKFAENVQRKSNNNLSAPRLYIRRMSSRRLSSSSLSLDFAF